MQCYTEVDKVHCLSKLRYVYLRYLSLGETQVAFAPLRYPVDCKPLNSHCHKDYSCVNIFSLLLLLNIYIYRKNVPIAISLS